MERIIRKVKRNMLEGKKEGVTLNVVKDIVRYYMDETGVAMEEN